MCILDILRCILCCEGEDEWDRNRYSRLPANPPQRTYSSYSYASRPVGPARTPPEKPPVPKVSGRTSLDPPVIKASHQPSLPLSSTSSNPSPHSYSWSESSKVPPSPPLTLKASPSSNLSSKPSPASSNLNSYSCLWSESSAIPPSSPLSSKANSSSSTLPAKASLPSNLSSKANSSSSTLSSKAPLPSNLTSKASPSSTLSSKATLPSNLISKPSPSSTLSSKASPSPALSKTVLSSPKVSLDTAPTTREIFDASVLALLRSKISPSPPSPSSRAPESERRSPQLPQVDHQIKLQRYEVPKDLQNMFEMGVVPEILKKPLSPSTYAGFFSTLLYSEDFYIERWSDFLLSGVTLKLHSRAAFEESRASRSRADNSRKTKKTNMSTLMNQKDFVTFEIDSVPEERPYLLSRDFVFLRPLDKKDKLFKGTLFRVVKSTTVLVEFGDDFHSQHLSTKRYDVSFSFNRVCLKREHQAISTELRDPLPNILFPDPVSTSGSFNLSSYVNHPYGSLNQGRHSVATRILNHKGPLPYLAEGPLSVMHEKLTSMGSMLQEAILKLYKTSAHCRILICAPMNRTCDALIRSLHEEIPRSKLFRANAAFRDYELVPGDIIRESLYKEEKACFGCPPLSELQNFQVITSTFVSSFRLYAAGVTADHFSHIFFVDASSVTEPEAAVALVHLVGKNTVTVVTGSSRNSPVWVRSDLSRAQGLKRSYFQRLLEREPYCSRDPMFISHLQQQS